MRINKIGILLIGISFFSSSIFSEEIGIVRFVVGKAFYERDGKKKPLKIRTPLFQGDIVYTQQGKAHIQLGEKVIIRLEPYTKIEIRDLSEKSSSLFLNKGTLLSKVVKGYSYEVSSPTTTAGVRGTEFMVVETPDKKLKKGVYVNEGVVEVEAEDPVEKKKVKEILKGREQFVLDMDGFRKRVLEEYARKKMEIFKKLELMRKANYELLKKQIMMNKKMLERFRMKKEKRGWKTPQQKERPSSKQRQGGGSPSRTPTRR